MKLRIDPKYIPLAATALVLALLYTVGCLQYNRFFRLRVAVNLFRDNAFLGVAAIGATLVILSGGIDLSVGSVVACTSILISTLIGPCGVHPLWAIAIALAAGAVFGALMGCLIQFFKLPPFLATLAGMFFARGMGFVIREQSLAVSHGFYTETIIEDLAISLTQRVDIPFTAICFLAFLSIAVYLAHFTRFGRTVYAIGGDEQSATLMGLPVARTKVLIYTFAGFSSALAGAVATFYMQSGNPAAFVGLELDAIASVVIGGTLLSGGVGFVGGTLMGVLILGLIQTIMNFQGNLDSSLTKIFIGVLVLVFILLQNFVSAATRRTTAKR